METIGKMCADFRRKIGITQQQIADEMGYSVYNISAFENGRNNSCKILAWYLDHGMVWDKQGKERLKKEGKAMSINEEAMKNPDKKATKDFIEKALSELEEDIEYIEKKVGTVLIGDRANFERARKDLINLTQFEVVQFISIWRKGIYNRYSIR